MINKTLEKFNIDMQFIRFVLVGLLNTAFGCALFAFFIALKMPYQLANFLTLLCGILFNFKTTGILVFKSHNNRLIFKFFTVYLLSYTISTSALALFEHFKILNINIAFMIMVIPTTIITFVLMKNWVFTKRQVD